MPKYAPHTRTSALARAKAKVGKPNRTGMCAYEVIVNILGIPGPWRWGGSGRAYAINYFLGAQKVVRTTDPSKVPAGAVAIWGPRKGATTAGGLAGHIAIGAGDGYCYSTDLPKSGVWGKVKITEVTRLWGKPLVGYVLVDGMGYTLTDPPAAPLTKWFDGAGWNTSASDSIRGKATWDRRLGDLMDALVHYDRDVYQLVEFETEGEQGRDAAKALDRIGYKIAVADNQRAIVVRKSARVGRTKVVTLAERGPAKDDKQIVLAEVWFKGSTNAAIIECGHLEFRDGAAYDKVRVTQAKQAKAATLAFAKACRVPSSRIVFYHDENSASQVSAAFGSTWPDLGTRDTYTGGRVSTLIGWNGVPHENGYRPDKVRVHKSRPARAGTSVTFAGDSIADHLPVIYTIGKA